MTDDRLKTGGAFDALPSSSDNLVSKLRGLVLNGYEIGEVIGSGGMGYVLRATRAEGDFDRVAAVKVVPATLGSSEFVQRFRTEVQILAKLNHPSIAQLYDAGETEEGWPYLVMEHVDGRPIDEYCAASGLSIDRRVELLLDVARAVRFAHARLIVHRDLKPSNVLVDQRGRPKLLDFGIAKLLEPGTPEHTVGHRPMTPQYASPEQLLGADITIGSDIYQLGILFLGVIAEESPFESATLQDAIRNAAAGQDATISERAAQLIPADLLAIITRCLHSDPEDRYRDVNALINDLTRYQEGFPVHARKGTRLYRLRKLVQRNIPATAFALLAAFIAIGGTASYTINMADARRLAEERAETASQILRAMSSMIADTYSELIESRGSRSASQAVEAQLQNEPLRLVLERTERLIDGVVTDQSALRAELLNVQGMTNRELNRLDVARPQLEEALALMRAAGDATGEVAVLHELMKLESMLEQNETAREYLDQAITLIDARPIAESVQAKVFTTAIVIAGDLAENERAVDFAKRAIAILEAAPGSPTSELARAYKELGLTYGKLEQSGPLREWLNKAVDLYTELEGSSYRGLSNAYNGLAWSYVMNGEYEPAMNYLKRDLEVARANFGEHHVKTAGTLMNIGVTLRRMGRYDEAIDHFLRVKSILDSLPGDYASRHAALFVNLGNTYNDLGNLAAAMDAFEGGLKIASDSNVPPRYRASLLNNSGDLMMVQGRLEDAIARLGLAVQAKTDIYGADNISTARSLLLLVQAHIKNGTLNSVPELLNMARGIYIQTYGADHRKLSFLELVTGQYRLATGDTEGARNILLSAHEHRMEEYEPDNIVVLSPLFALISTELKDANTEQARNWLAKTQTSVEKLSTSHPESIEAGVLEVELLTAEGRASEAMSAKSRMLDKVDQHFPARSDWKSRLDAIRHK